MWVFFIIHKLFMYIMNIKKIIKEESEDFEWVSSELNTKPSGDEFLSIVAPLPIKIEDYLIGIHDQTFITLIFEDGTVAEFVMDTFAKLMYFDNFQEYADDFGGDFTDYEGFFAEFGNSKKFSEIDPEFNSMLMNYFKPEEIWINQL